MGGEQSKGGRVSKMFLESGEGKTKLRGGGFLLKGFLPIELILLFCFGALLCRSLGVVPVHSRGASFCLKPFVVEGLEGEVGNRMLTNVHFLPS